MKGKGERTSASGGGSGGSSSKREFSDESCPLTFPNFKAVDHTKTCPRYTSIVGRDADVNDGMDCVGLEEIDSLQIEFETLSASVVRRMRQLQSEIQVLSTSSLGTGSTPQSGLDKGKTEKTATPSAGSAQGHSSSTPTSAALSSPGGDPSTPGSVNKRSSIGKGKTGASTVSHPGPSSGGGDEKPPAKRMRTDSGRATYAQTVPTLPPGSKNKGKVHQSRTSESDQLESPKPLDSSTSATGGSRQSRNMTPCRFWAMVEPYCAPITQDDLKYLEEQVKVCEDVAEYMKIPALGRHYADKWAEEDMLQDQREGAKITERRKSSTGNGLSNGSTLETVNLLKRVDDNDEESSPFGPLTQRLIQGLLEENIIASLDDTDMISDADAFTAATISPRSLAKQLHLGNTAILERRIKRELEEVGILMDGAEDSVGEGARDNGEGEDEILMELRKKQSELKALSQQNSAMLKQLHKQAKEEMARQQLREKLAAADNEVMEAYRRVQAAKSKKKTPTKKEKDQFYKALKDRDVISKELLKSGVS